MDIIRILDLGVFAYHGVYPEEREKGQVFFINAELTIDARKPGMSDDLNKSVNYADVCEFISKFVKENTFNLIETVAEQLSQALLLRYDLIKEVLIEVRKPSAPIDLDFESISVEIERSWHEAYIAFGSNMGDKNKYIDEALEAIAKLPQIKILKQSARFVTKPYGNVEQDDFVNGVIKVKTLLPPEELLQILQQIEQHAGRKREIHWGPRTLDLDILFYDDSIIAEDNLVIPHPDMKNRTFVLEPLFEIAPYKIHPVYHKTISDLYKELIAK